MAASLRFAAAARRLAVESRARGLVVPGFRSPPRVPGASRTIRRRPEGAAVVAVDVRGRPFPDVAADMVEGVLVANRLVGEEADRHRAALLAVVLDDDGGAAAA